MDCLRSQVYRPSAEMHAESRCSGMDQSICVHVSRHVHVMQIRTLDSCVSTCEMSSKLVLQSSRASSRMWPSGDTYLALNSCIHGITYIGGF